MLNQKYLKHLLNNSIVFITTVPLFNTSLHIPNNLYSISEMDLSSVCPFKTSRHLTNS